MLQANWKKRALFFIGLCLCPPVFGSDAAIQLREDIDPIAASAVADWHEDLAYLSQQIVNLHPDPFFGTDEAKFVAMRDWIDRNLSAMDRSQIILSFMRLVALVGVSGHDGHSGLWPYQPPANFHLYPLRLHWFSDGVYVVDAEPSAELLGAKLETINGHPVADLLSAVDPFISRDGPMWVRSWAPIHIVSPEFQQALGFGSDDGQALFGYSIDGQQRSISLQPISHDEYHARFPMMLWTAALPAAEKPRYLHREDDYFWFEEWPGSKTLYFQYNAITRENKEGKSLKKVVRELKRIIDSGRVDRLVVDVRSNGGGDNTAYGKLLNFLGDDPFFEDEGRLYIVIGRITFSAGVNFVTDAERRTNAIFVGEPTGGSPNQYGDAKGFELPNSGIRARVSTRYWNKAGDTDQRLDHQPDIAVPISSAEYFQDRDAAMEAILEQP